MDQSAGGAEPGDATAANAAREIARLSAENARLREQVAATAVIEPTAPVTTTQREHHRGRAFVAALLVAVGVLLAPTAVITAWTKTEVTDTERFVSTFAPLASDPAVQAVLVDDIVTQIDQRIDINALVGDLFDGLATLNLPPNAAAALQLFEAPAAQGVESLIRSTTESVITSQAFADVWAQTLRVSHTQLIAALQGDTSGTVVIGPNGELGIQIGPIIDAVKTELVAQGLTIAQNIPSIDRTIQVAQSDSLVQARTGYEVLNTLGVWLPIVALAFLAAGVLTAKRRARTLILAGSFLALMMAVLAAGLSIGRIIFVNTVSPAYLPIGAAQAFYDAVTPYLFSTALSVGLVGFGVAVVAYLAGPFTGGRNLRRATVHGAALARASAERGGVTTGRFGVWLYSVRRVVRVAVVVVAAAVIVFVRPLTPGVIGWTVLISIVVIVLLELLMRPEAHEVQTPEEAEAEFVPVEAAASARDTD
ncbi:hypothetical protein [Cryobacterium roopkundense]|uniref:Integral membrane protein n=1 Tax=Cryobacterium roopkundense TaxID=1001240 RepID=A0A7W9E6M7_9MICO|nr:hypothetical protein [Cryobacterium roopkundense]MBB5643584.1 hypothetical protein [Cryobacterium roopkundense]